MKIRPEFKKHLMNERGDERTAEIAIACSRLADDLETLCPPGRHLALARTSVEQAYQWGITAAALDLLNVREPEPTTPMGGGRHG